MLDLAAFQQEQHRLVRFAREVRGGILAGGYDVESIIDSILLKVFFPRPEDEDTRSLFDDVFLKRGSLNLARKLSILKIARARLSSLADIIPQELAARLERVRSVRNEFAHYAIAFNLDGPEPIKKLKATLVGPERDLDLTDDVVKELFEFFAQVSADLNDIVKALEGSSGDAIPYNTPPQADA